MPPGRHEMRPAPRTRLWRTMFSCRRQALPEMVRPLRPVGLAEELTRASATYAVMRNTVALQFQVKEPDA
jgi:hypothetical protein